jgi:hypothetical protein
MRRFISAALPVAVATGVAIAVALPAVPAFASGAGYTWIGSAAGSGGDNHSWTDRNNWSPSGVPGSGDSVAIAAPDPSHCTAQVNNIPTVTLADLSITQSPDKCGVSINGGNVTVTGSFTWDGGSIATPLTLAAGALGTVSGTNGRLNDLAANMNVAGSLTLSGLTNTGDANSSALHIDNPDVLHVLSGATLTSSGANDVNFLSCCNAPAKIVNDGTLAVSGGDFTVDAVEVDQNGTLVASSGGRLVTESAPVTAGAGAHYAGTGGWLIEDGAKAKMSGTQNLGGNFHLELGPLVMNAGAQLGGTATFAGSGTIDWTGGTIEGNFTIGHGVTLRATGAHTDNGKRVLSGQDGVSSNAASVLTNHGTMRFDQNAGVLTASNAKLVNATDGVVSLAPGTQFTTIGCCVSPNRIVNHGTLTVPTGTATAPALITGVAYQSDATTSVAPNRELQLDEAPGSLTSATINGGGTVAITAPTAVGGTITVAHGTKLALQTGGSLNGTATLSGPGALQWTGGSVSGQVTVSIAGGTAITGTDQKYVSNVNGGSTPSTVTLSSKTTFGAGTKAKTNELNVGQSRLTLASSTSLANFTEIYAGTVLNTGALTVDPGSSGAATRSGSGPLTNRGTLTVKRGKFAINGDFIQAAGTTTVAAGAQLALLFVTRSVTMSGGVLQGAGTIDAGVANNAGTVKPAGTSTGTLHISGAYTQGTKGTLAVDLAAKSRDLLAVTGTVTLHGKLVAHDLGSYAPRVGAKYRVLSGSSVTGSVACGITSGGGSTRGHWATSPAADALSVIWRTGRHTTC